MFKRSILFISLIILSVSAALAQDAAAVPQNAVLWEPGDIASRDLMGGAGASLRPELKRSRYIGRQTGGNNLKHRIEDGNGVEWIVKVADESQPEIAAGRLLWAVGYKTEIDHVADRFKIDKVGNYRNVRLEARPKSVDRSGRWSWTKNPFLGTREFDGLKIMMALVNNWDLKDENTVILTENGKQYYVVSDLGSSFGKLADKSFSRTGRSVNDPEDYAKSGFIKGVNNGIVEFHYRGMAEDLMNGITVENARWLADLLMQLSDKQIEDSFRAANYEPEKVQIYSRAVKARIRALDEATKNTVVSKN